MKLLEQYGLTNEMIDSFAKYRDLLLKWNEKFNLTAIKDKDEIEEKHFIDSLYLDRYINVENKTLLDVGTGAGFPGLALAIAHPSLQVTLLEANGKKITFLKEVVNELKLTNVIIVQSRAEEFFDKEHFDIVTARAVKELNILLELTVPFVKVGGVFVAYKSKAIDEEIKNASKALKILDLHKISKYEYNLPKSKDDRVLLEILKEKRTKSKFPRPYSEIVKKPL